MTKERFYYLLESRLPQMQLQALHFVHNDEDAKELMQNTVLQMLEMREEYQDKNFGAWANSVLFNQRRNLSRRKEVIEYCEEIDEYDELYCDYTEEQIDIDCALESVSATMRSTAELFLQGYRYEEIAKMQEIGMGTVKSRINRSRNLLQTILRDYRYRL